MRVVVLGAGGVGGYFGGKLARAGESVTMLARGAHLEAIRRHGLRVRSLVDGDWVAPVEARDDLAGLPHADAVLLCVKSFDTEAALERARPVVGPATAVLSLQNGVESAEIVEASLGRAHAVGGAAYVFAVIEAPGVIVHRLAGRIVLGELDGRLSPRVEALRAAFERAGVPVEAATHMRRVLWEKYLFIGAQAGMTALTRQPSGVLRAIPECWRLYRMIVEELAALARAEGVALPGDAVDGVMKAAEALGPQATSSLQHDLLAGKPLELEALHGHAVRLGERHGVATPACLAVYAALKPYVAGAPA